MRPLGMDAGNDRDGLGQGRGIVDTIGCNLDTVANAGNHVAQPSLVLGAMNFYPLPGKLQGSPLDLSAFAGHMDYALDFNSTGKGSFAFRGAYAGAGTNPGWGLAAEQKVGGPAGGGGLSPAPPTGLQVM